MVSGKGKWESKVREMVGWEDGGSWEKGWGEVIRTPVHAYFIFGLPFYTYILYTSWNHLPKSN
jgi:hypothetical protein